MCGIIGYSNSSKWVVDLASATKILKHRGPDDDGIYECRQNGVGLGHTRLSIIDTSDNGKQPFESQESKSVITFNGEIYNYKELKKDLLAKKYGFNSNTDTEVLLNLYDNKGYDAINYLNGIYVFAIWDPKSKSIFLSRDKMGVKPLYYFQSDGYFAFSSELKALLTIIPEKNEIDLECIHRYLSFLWSPGDSTPIKGIKKLLPGESLVIKNSKVFKRWHLDDTKATKSVFTKIESINNTDKFLRNAVHSQMVSDVPLGAFLSGGLDSSSIVTFAREINPRIECFTIDIEGGFGEGFSDDLPYAKRVAKHLEVPLNIVSTNPKEMSDHLNFMVEQLDEPLTDLAPLNVFFISQLARKKGIKVLLSGAGGDDVFTGYRRHVAINYEKYWKWLPSSILSYAENLSKKINVNHPLSRRLRSVLRNASQKGNNSLIAYFNWIDESDLRNIYTHEFNDAISNISRDKPMKSYLDFSKLSPDPIEKVLALERRFFLADHNLNYTDKMSMKEGVEVRVPFLDLDLVNMSYSIPSKYKQRGREGKWVLKKAMEKYLPKDIIYRPKSGFGAPVRRWVKNELSEIVKEVVFSQSLSNRGFFDLSRVKNLYENNLKGSIDASYLLLSIVVLELWCRKYLDKEIKNIK